MLDKPWEYQPKGLQGAFRTLRKVFYNWWTVEILSMATAVTTFITLLLQLRFWNHRPVQEWDKWKIPGLFETLQAFVSLLVTLLRASMMLSVAAAINQLRWYYAQHSPQGRRVGFIQSLDDASRGILGSLTLLFSRDFFNWSSVGCLITVAVFFLGTLTQNAVILGVEQQNKTESAAVSVALTYEGYHENGNSMMISAPAYIEAAMVTGWVYGASIQFRNASSMEDIFPMSVKCPDNSTCFWKNITTISIYSECAERPSGSLIGLKKGYDLNMTAQSEFFAGSVLEERKGLISHVAATGNSKNGTVEHAECALYWGLKHIPEAQYSNGTLRYNSTMHTVGGGANRDGSLLIPPSTFKDTFNITRTAAVGMSRSMNMLLNRKITRDEKNWGMAYDDMTTRIFRIGWNIKVANGVKQALQDTLTMYINNLVLFTSAAIHANSEDWLRGDSQSEIQVYVIQPRYLIFPGVVLSSSIVFFLVTVCMTRKDQVWKSSLLPLLYHGFAEPFPQDLKSMVNMMDESEAKKFRMGARDERGLRLYELCDEETVALTKEHVETLADK